MGVWLEPEMGDEKIWFRRVSGSGNGDGYAKAFSASGSSAVKRGDDRQNTVGLGGVEKSMFSRMGPGVRAPLFK